MKKQFLRGAILAIALCCLAAGAASASLVTTTVPFPTAGDNYFAANDGGAGTIAPGGQTGYMWAANDWVASSIFVLPTNSVVGLAANWTFENFLGGGNTETWDVFINGVNVASFVAPDDNYNGDLQTVTGSISFAGIAPVSGGYQVVLVLENDVPFGGGSVAWLDGGTTDLTYVTNTGIPEPSSLILFGSGALGLAGLLRRKLNF